MAQPMRCVNQSLLLPAAARDPFNTRRASSKALVSTMRWEVAVGSARLAVMFSAMRKAGPRKGISCSPEAVMGEAAGAGEVCSGAGATAPWPLPLGWDASPARWPLASKTFFQLSSTALWSWRYWVYSSSSSQLLMPNEGLDSDMGMVRCFLKKLACWAYVLLS